MKKVMRCIFSIFAAIAYRIKSILKTVLKLLFTTWHRPTVNLVNNLIPLGLWQLWTLSWDGRINFKMLFLKILRLSDFWIFLSILFHSITVEGKKEFFKKIMSHFKRRNIFDESCKAWSARHSNNIEQVCMRLLVEDLIEITKFSISSSFFERF